MISENKKGVKAVKHTVKTKNPVAKAHQTIGSGSGEHKDKKRVTTQIRGQKHKSKELAEFAMLAPIAGAVGRAVVGGIARTAANSFANKEPTENSEYDDEAGMADNNLETLKRAVEGLDDMINSGDNLPEWCQEKIAVAKSMLVTVWDYMQSEENSLAEGSDNQEIGQQMANDGVTYSPEKEKEIINLMSQYMQKAGMSSKQIRYLLSYDEDYISDQLSFLPRQGVKEGVAGPKKCWPGHRKVGTQPGTGKNKGKRVNDCEKISESNWYEVRLQTMLNETLKK